MNAWMRGWVQIAIDKKSGELSEASVRRFNFYKDIAGSTRDFSAFVKALPAGCIVAICISDTAAAASRPLGQTVSYRLTHFFRSVVS